MVLCDIEQQDYALPGPSQGRPSPNVQVRISIHARPKKKIIFFNIYFLKPGDFIYSNILISEKNSLTWDYPKKIGLHLDIC